MNYAELSIDAAKRAEECSRRGDREGYWYALGLRDAYATAAAFPEREEAKPDAGDFVFPREMLREADEAFIDEEVARIVAAGHSTVTVLDLLAETYPSIVAKLNAAGVAVVLVD